jgi:uncharacterized protein
VYNKIDVATMQDVDRLAREPNSVVISCNLKLNYDHLLARIWEQLGLTRVYTKRRGEAPDFSEPLVLTDARDGSDVEAACKTIHRDLLGNFKYALVWGRSTRHNPQRCGLAHALADEDVIQVVKIK